MHPNVVAVEPKPPFLVTLTFADGSRGSVDLSRWIVDSRGVFAALRDPVVFSQVAVDHEAGTIVWPNGADLDTPTCCTSWRTACRRPDDGLSRRAVLAV